MAHIQLHHQRIIDAALVLASTPGVDTISIRDLGRSLGVDHTALYRHVRNKEELMSTLLDKLLEEAVRRVRAPEVQWYERLQNFALAVLEQFVTYPSVGAEAVILTTHGLGERNAMELMLRSLSTAGLQGGTLVDYYGLVSSHILARAAGIARSRMKRGVAPDEDVPWMDAPITADDRLHPMLGAHASAVLGLVDNRLYMKGLDVLLDAANREAQREAL